MSATQGEAAKVPPKKRRWPWDNPDSLFYKWLRTSRHGQEARPIGKLNPPISGNVKQVFYLLSVPLHVLNGWFYRTFRAPRSGTIKVHLGPGKVNYLPGWIHLEGNLFSPSCDVWVNLNNPLPFEDNTVDVIYSHHVVEHLKDIFFHFEEMYRVLKPGGIFRVGGPNGDTALRKFAEKDVDWFSDFPHNRTSLGGRFDNWLFCGSEHLSILTLSYLEEIAGSAGFINIKQCFPRKETSYPDRIDASVLALEGTVPVLKDPFHLIVEGIKPFSPTPAAA